MFENSIFPLLNNYFIADIIDKLSRLMLAEESIKETVSSVILLMKTSFEAIVESQKLWSKKPKYCLTTNGF